MGLPASASEIVNTVVTTTRWLAANEPDAIVFPISEEPLKRALRGGGIRTSEDPTEIDIVIASYDRSFEYRKLQIAFDALWRHRRARLFATNPDPFCPVADGGGEPDAAAITAAIEACTGVRCELHFGKPGPVMLSAIAGLLELSPEDCVLTGDRLATDIRAARDGSMASALVLTGETRPAEVPHIPDDSRPDYVLDRIDRLIPRAQWHDLGWDAETAAQGYRGRVSDSSQARLRETLNGATDTEQVVLAPGGLESVAELFDGVFGEQPAAIVADENTFAAAGEAARRGLEANGRRVETYVFPGRPVLHADYANIEALVGWLRTREAVPVAVGGGTVNDIAKRAAFECGRGYVCVATAASVDGYTSFGASITKEGVKQTLECSAPRAVLADLAVPADAPAKMTSAGYADLLAKIPARADWIIADALEVEPIDSDVWSLVQDPLREATGRPADLHAGDLSAMEGLTEGLLMSGLAMQSAGSSRPASRAEHQFSHLWEMEGLGQEAEGDQPPLSHGFKVGVGTVSIAALYERLLERDLTGLNIREISGAWPKWSEVERRIRSTFPPSLEQQVVEQSRAKDVEADQLCARLSLISERWPELRERVGEQVLPAWQLRDQLREAGCPTTPAEIGLSHEQLRATYRRAQMIRPRYTILDLLNEIGLFDECVAELFSDGGFWA
jgi:glycerol-1-phosphate dehydrogenase [NAD(P)+]